MYACPVIYLKAIYFMLSTGFVQDAPVSDTVREAEKLVIKRKKEQMIS